MPDPPNDTVPVSGDLLLEAVLDAAASLIILITPEGDLVRWNRACERLTGTTAADLATPGGMFGLVPEDEHGVARDTVARLRRGESPVTCDLHWRGRGGELRLISWSNTALTAPDGTVTHIVGTGIDVTERRGLEERLRHLADHDALTGLINRRRFEEELERHLAQGRRYGMGGALLVLDLDGFKAVNDNHGHRAGDRVLIAVATTLKRRLRESDVVARLGGDEFAVLLPRAAPREAERVCQALEQAIRDEVPAPGERHIEASVGFAPFTDSVGSIDEVLSAADASMYAVKAGQPRA
jgi:diguanylate cyclase (GGDEF)-like protein/PAS domain S-box-containing protein